MARTIISAEADVIIQGVMEHPLGRGKPIGSVNRFSPVMGNLESARLQLLWNIVIAWDACDDETHCATRTPRP